MRSNMLDTDHEDTVKEVVLEILEDTGYDNAQQAIPGLVATIVHLARSERNTEALLDEAANLLADADS
jgi:hypothetical protein